MRGTPSFTPTVAVRLYRPVAMALEASGVEAARVFAELGIPDPVTSGWEVRRALPELAGIWDHLSSVTHDRYFPLRAAAHVDLTTCDVVTYLEANAKTVQAALRAKFEYLPLMTDAIEWTLEVSGDEARLTLHERPARPPLAPVAEYLLAARHVFFRQFGPPGWSLRFVDFRHPEPEQLEPFIRTFGVRPRFGAASDQLGFDAAWLNAPMRSRDDALSDLLRRYADQASDRLVPASSRLGDRVRTLLHSGVDPGIGSVARQLGVSPRTLQRSLAREGENYRDLVAEARCAVAERLLARRELALAEVAHALGFNDLPAFHHAFVRWWGITPGDFRRRHLGNAFVEPVHGRLGRRT